MLLWQRKFMYSFSSHVESYVCQILLDSDKTCLNYMGFKHRINANPSCDVTIFVKGAQKGEELSSWFLTVFHIS